MSTASGSGHSLYPTPVPAELPTNDNDRLFFYVEVLIANIPTLISDLSSPKYTFLSFSEKTRNEVKQKSALIQSVSRTYNTVLATYKQLEDRRKEVEALEVELVRASPPRFMTSQQAAELKAKGRSEGSGSSTAATGPIMILKDEDIITVRYAEEEHREETEVFGQLSKAASEMEESCTAARAQCEQMTQHVQVLKAKYDVMYAALVEKQRERRLLAVVRGEFEQRQALQREALDRLQGMEANCRNQELEIIRSSIDTTLAEAAAIRAGLEQRKERQEVELAAYQIAYKESQGECETLKDDVAFLKRHQVELEKLAKQQQAQESRQNSLKRLVLQSLMWASSKDGATPLTAEELGDVRSDHPLVSVLTANVFAMNEQRKEVAGILAQVNNAFDNDAVKVALDKVHEVLVPAIALDADALNIQ